MVDPCFRGSEVDKPTLRSLRQSKSLFYENKEDPGWKRGGERLKVVRVSSITRSHGCVLIGGRVR